MINMVRKHLTVEDCMQISDAGYEIYINDGIVYSNYPEEIDDTDELAATKEDAFS